MALRLALLGGTFDPIHFGHLALAADVQHALQLDRVVFVPAAQQPFKLGRSVAPARDRLRMVQLAIADDALFDVSAIEIERGGVSYSVDTVVAFRRMFPAAELFFIVGADAAGDLARWHRVEELVRHARLVIVDRPGVAFDLQRLYAALPPARGRTCHVPGPAFDIASSEIRRRLRAGLPVRYHLPAAVYRYIQTQGLYVRAASDAPAS
ncbi:nicotinate-nucleotide adenylyltransferase [Kallotenue papyrolyticum]|uniref:nicotinate-nucleotide adenylyltransferase n=1 Tax=Kallotenue papyrolyticum TaxID=1325125 RepID=UPI00047862CE|nr:nicotinate-nucleotide adenylyltransferase [Kallotenue papyrolyticum]